MRWCSGLALGAALAAAAAAGRADDPAPKPAPAADPAPQPPAKPKATPPKADPPAPRKGPAPTPKDDLQRLQGTWPIESWTEGGKPVPDLAKRAVFFGGNVFIFRQNGKTLQAGPVQLDPLAELPAFDAAVRDGENRGTLLGVYRFEGDALTLCFDPAGKTRPAGFDPAPADGLTVIKLKRPKPPADEQLDITGRYTSELVEATGKTVTTEAVVERRGDAYLVTYTLDGKLLFVATALRKGNVLSMCWVSSGQAGVSQYRIEKGPRLVGEYTTLAGIGVTGTEVLVPWRRVD